MLFAFLNLSFTLVRSLLKSSNMRDVLQAAFGPNRHLPRPCWAVALLVAAVLAQAVEEGGKSNYAQVFSTSLYSRDDSMVVSRGKFRFLSVTDMRQLSRDNSRLLGSSSAGPSQERSWLWANDPVDQEVKRQLDLWFPPSSSDSVIGLRVEIASCESWTVPTTNPAAAKALVRLRVVSADKKWRGKLIEASLVREGPNTPANQATLLRTCLRTALQGILDQDWNNMPPLAGIGETGPDPDPWTNALKTSGVKPQSVSRTLIHASQTIGESGYGTGVRAIFYHEPETGLNPEFWVGVRIRDPGMDSYSDVWVGEVEGGKGYQKRLGSTDIVMVSTTGVIFGIEKFKEDGHKPSFWKYVGLDLRTGGRYEPEGFSGLSAEAGAHGAIRIPSTLQFLDFGFYVELGHRF